MKQNRLALIGSGATAIYLLKHIKDNLEVLKNEIQSITIFERGGYLGMGMPYSPETTDIYNLANISSEEIPELPKAFADWLREQDSSVLSELNVTELPIDESEVYSRLALGSYLREQYLTLIHKLESGGIHIEEVPGTEVRDIEFLTDKQRVAVKTENGVHHDFSKVVIATGHAWKEEDRPKKGYYGSPWPIHKLLPKEGEPFNFTIGTLGASLSAFDVATSLAHRHGKFFKNGKELTYHLRSDAQKFKVVMHSAEGWLPHLQYEQEEPMRKIYRHTDREELLSILDAKGFLRIDTFFDKVCRSALMEALEKDGLGNKAELMKKADFGFGDFVRMMSDDHEYTDSFEGMKKEMIAARDSVLNNRPIHWKETLDDLMYCLNFHAELLPAEDYLFFQKEVMSFLMNVIAALPLSSADILLALHDAGCIELIPGRVEVQEDAPTDGKTRIKVEAKDGSAETMQYTMFINCAGQKSIQLEDFPFVSLVRMGNLRKARAEFESEDILIELRETLDSESIFMDKNRSYMYTGGIDVDASYRIIGKDGLPNDRIMDITFTHTSGIRPYSYGLQACNATSKILVESWILALGENTRFVADIENMTEMFDENEL
ncbi:FAD/NAD(P)-binding protein [Pricia sp.]|uniref:FAD/NAD(P)-binding protein n=1 Tax=Pricia sp. TaxID=2268138 RepID=UPI0035934CD0